MDFVSSILPELLTLQNLLYANIGVFIGIIIGALPGLTATMGVALMLPLTFTMDTVPSIVLLLGIYFGGIYGGSITAVLLNTPGTPASAVTAIDGYKLMLKGHAGKALDMALKASFIGGEISCIALLFFAPVISKFAVKFNSADMTALCLFGLTVIVSLCGNNPVKGLTMAGLGLFLASIGIDPVSGVTRLTFGIRGLTAGINLITALIGIFAISEILNKIFNLRTEKMCIRTDSLTESCSKQEMKSCAKTISIGSVIGIIVGAIPGTGAAMASFLSYGTSKKYSKKSDEYGEGSLEGVAACESANNAVTGAALIPLLSLGIPGDSVTAVMLGALTMHSLTPGPLLFNTDGPLVYAILLAAFFVNVFMFIQGKFLIKGFIHIVRLSMKVIVPIIFVLCITGTFAIRNSLFDVRVMIILGVIAFIAIRRGYPALPMVLAFVLGPTMEKYMRRALQASKGSFSTFIESPISVVFIVLSILSIVYSLYKNNKNRR